MFEIHLIRGSGLHKKRHKEEQLTFSTCNCFNCATVQTIGTITHHEQIITYNVALSLRDKLPKINEIWNAMKGIADLIKNNWFVLYLKRRKLCCCLRFETWKQLLSRKNLSTAPKNFYSGEGQSWNASAAFIVGVPFSVCGWLNKKNKNISWNS